MPLKRPDGTRSLAARAQWPRSSDAGLATYAQLLEANSDTSRYMQAMTLFDFLAYPDSYADFQKVWSVVIRYLSGERTPERTRLESRFHQLGSGETRVDPTEKKPSGKPVKHKTPGLRHRVVPEGGSPRANPVQRSATNAVARTRWLLAADPRPHDDALDVDLGRLHQDSRACVHTSPWSGKAGDKR